MKKRIKMITITLIVSVLLVGMGIGIKKGIEIHNYRIEKQQKKQAKKEKALKKIEDEIVEDLAKRYKDIHSVKFYEYSISPMDGTFSISVTINNQKLDNYSEDYELSPDESHPRYTGQSREPMGEPGTSEVKDIKITYNFHEFNS